ncbi:MAG: hypothetical protein HY554_13530 [Elusimicrobia bacterium]|nr:hypothetical protein [Elusimicrobiota bacterium]
MGATARTAVANCHQLVARLSHVASTFAIREREAAAVFGVECRRRPLPCLRCAALLSVGASPGRCDLCRKSERRMAGRWLSRVRLPRAKWLSLVRCFELDLPVWQSAACTRVSRASAFRAFHTLRLSLASLEPAWEPVLRAFSMGDAAASPQLFGVEWRGESVRVSPIPPGPEWRAPGPSDRVLHRDGFLYTAGRAPFEAVIWNRKVRAPAGRRRRWAREERRDPFLAFLLNQVAKRYGARGSHFPLHLRECEVRFNHRKGGLFELLLGALARPRMRDRPGSQALGPCGLEGSRTGEALRD